MTGVQVSTPTFLQYSPLSQMSSPRSVTPHIFSIVSLSMIVLGSAVSTAVFVADATNRDISNLWFSVILWPAYFGVLFIIYVISSYLYIRRLPNANESMERASYYFPIYQWKFWSWCLYFLVLFLSALVVSSATTSKVGLGFEPDFSLLGDQDTSLYRTLSIIMIFVSYEIFLRSFDILVIFASRIYRVLPVQQIQNNINECDKVALIVPFYRAHTD